MQMNLWKEKLRKIEALRVILKIPQNQGKENCKKPFLYSLRKITDNNKSYPFNNLFNCQN